MLDEFDKSLEIGFEEEMKEIILELTQLKKKVLTSATQKIDIPAFVGISEPTLIDFSSDGIEKLNITRVTSPDKDKLEALGKLINHLNGQQGIVFCNFKSSIQRVSEYLHDINIDHGCFYGGMEQQDRERALIKFRNGTHNIIVATDLAARGIDVPEINFIIHYHLPLRANEFTHRNGRTARMHSEGTAYVLHWEEEDLPDFIQILGVDATPVNDLELGSGPPSFSWQTLFISGGRKDKISKGDIAGLFFKQAELKKDELGVIELKQDCAFVAVPTSKVEHVIKMLDNSRLKKKKVRVRKI